MPSVSPLIRLTKGAYYWNDFTGTDDTTKAGTGTWTQDTTGTGTIKGTTGATPYTAFAVPPGPISTTDYLIVTRCSVSIFNAAGAFQLLARASSAGAQVYANMRLYYDTSTILWVQSPSGNGVLTVPTLTVNTLYEFAYLIRGVLASGNQPCWGGYAPTASAGVQGVEAAGNLSGEAAGYAAVDFTGGSTNQTITIDYILVCGWVITIRGLANGMQFQVLRGTVPVAKSLPSSGGVCTLDLSTFTNLASFPPYDGIQVLDAGGNVLTTYSAYRQVFDGDIYSSSVISSVDATGPYLGQLAVNGSRLGMIAKSGAYSDFIDAQISPPAPNTIGQFDVWIPDPLGNEKFNFIKGTPVWFYGVVGPYFGSPLLVGLVDRITPHRLPGGVQLLEVAGQDWAAGWINLHGYAATTQYAGVNAAAVLGSDIAQQAPEVQVGPSLQVPSNQITSDNIIVGRSGWDVSVEFATLSSSDRTDWVIYGCQGLHFGEHKPNLHLSPMNQGASPIPILSNQTFKLLAPDDRRQLISLAAVHFSYTYLYNSSDTVFIYSGLRTMIRALPQYLNPLYSTDITSVANYIVQAGDCLEYDVYLQNGNSRLFVDLQPPITVQSAKGVWVSGANMTVTLPNAPASGDTLVLACGADSSSGYSISSVAGTGMTWTKRVSKLVTSWDNEIWTATVGASAGKVITITFTGTPDYGALADVREYVGLGTFTLDQTATDTTSASKGGDTGATAATTQPNELLIGSIFCPASTSSTGQTPVPNGFTLVDGVDTLIGSNHYSLAYLEKTVQSIGSAFASTTFANAANSVGCIATFKTSIPVIPPLSSNLGLCDQAGIPVLPTAAIANMAVGQWYHRRIPLPAFWVGQTITGFIVQDSPVSAGDYVGGLRHIYVTNGGTSSNYLVNKVIWDGDGTAIFGNVVNNGCTQITRALGSPVTTISFPYVGFGHPTYGIVPKMEDKPWMTSAQSTTYGALVVKNLAEGFVQLQAWMALDGRYGQGQYVPIWDSISWGSAILQGITYDFTRRLMELTLQLMDDRNKKLLTVRGYGSL